ncbi:MAG: 8-oxo-dGTP diphosphatase [Clostridia bacterium]|nr:8-oxo-dGTP diphosphatase [Clostridia bacterium]
MINSTLCYLERGNKYLMLYRNKKRSDPNGGKWIGVGGKLEENESPPDCLIREVREETGLELESYEYRGIVTFVSDKWETEQMHLFTSRDFSGTLSVCDEGDLEWIEKSRVASLPLWEGDRVFLPLLESEKKFFSLKLCYEGEKLVNAVLNGKELNV